MVIALLFALAVPFDARFYSTVGEERWEVRVTLQDVQQAPRWAEAEPWPPISPRVAAASATTQLRGLVSHPERWQLRAISLRKMADERWIYVVEYLGGSPPATGNIQLVVLMNGQTIAPIIPASPAP